MGLATNRPGETVQQMIERADACLYAAKRAGRNQTVCESDPAGGLAQSRVA
jgi:diguanylate cyclase